MPHGVPELGGHSNLLTLGTLLGGLSSAITGIGSLLDLGADFEVPPWADGTMIGGALTMLMSGVAGAKMTALAGVASTPALSMGCGAVWAYSSVAFLRFMYEVVTRSTTLPPSHSPKDGSAEAMEHPAPPWMNLRVYNWAVTGRVGVGKSTLINTLRGLKASDSGAAKVGVTQTTFHAKPYAFSRDLVALCDVVRLWDLPGQGSVEFPSRDYIKQMGLRYFDGVLIVTADAFYECDLELMRELRKFNVPVYMVRNKMDAAIACNLEDYEIPPEATVTMVSTEMAGYGCPFDRTFCLSAKYPYRKDLGFADLVGAMGEDLAASRSTTLDVA